MSSSESYAGNIRKICQDAQGRIMRLQQATNTQVGITSSMRTKWFEELRSIAQCFVAAQQASAKLEGAAKAERGNISASLKEALDELEEVKEQRNAARKEAAYLREFLASLTERLPTKKETRPSNDILHQLPNAVEDMPFSPQKGDSAQALQRQTSTNRGYHSSHSRFFGQSNVSQSASTSGQSSPDFYGELARGQFSHTPGTARGPFNAPTVSHQTIKNSGSASQALTTSSHNFHKNFGHSRPTEHTRTHTSSSFHHGPSRPHTPNLGLDVECLYNSTRGQFFSGVTLTAGTTDASRSLTIFQFFNEVRVWTEKYCASPKQGSVENLCKTSSQLWDYVLNLTYPNNRRSAISHATFLLTNPTTRCYFIARLVIQYVTECLWIPEAWEGHNRRLTETLVDVKKKLDPKYGFDGVLQPHERHSLVELRSKAIYDLISQPNWINTEASRIDKTLMHFKGLVQPMLSSEGINFHDALNNLRGICGTALRLSAVLNTCRLSFQFQFGECGVKFSEQSHRALNNFATSRELQTRQWRVMCVVTPGITYRNDAGISVDPRMMAKANVLVMQ